MRIPPIPDITASKKQTSGVRHGVWHVIAALSLCGCKGIQSSLDPQGPQAQAIAGIAWSMFWGAAAILLLVMALALYAVYRTPGKRAAPDVNRLILAGGVALPVVTLSILLVYGTHAMGSLRAQAAEPAAQIDVVGNQWWWDVHYRGSDGRVVSTANEIRIPAGQAVTVSLRSNDVIHSFWVPNLAGKIDLVPGRSNRIALQADRPGVFRGQCAEFCGAQHARMALLVIAETPEAHAAWLERQAAPARVPSNHLAVRGREAFAAHCAVCHTVRGVSTAHMRGPDLTHVASRQFLAAGTLPNNRENLAAFIAHSQTIKPGNAMPSQAHLGEDALQAIVAWLEELE